MSRWLPCKRRDFIKKLRCLGFQGPYSGSRHEFMVIKGHRLAIPSSTEYTVPQLRMMVKEVGAILGREIKPDEWNDLA